MTTTLGRVSGDIVQDIGEFHTLETDLLNKRDLSGWLDLVTEDFKYWIRPRRHPTTPSGHRGLRGLGSSMRPKPLWLTSGRSDGGQNTSSSPGVRIPRSVRVGSSAASASSPPMYPTSTRPLRTSC